MSRSRILSVLAFLAVIGVFIGLNVLPRMWRDSAIRDVVQDVAHDAAGDAARKAAAQALPGIARDLAKQVERDMAEEAKKPAEETKAGATQPLLIERAGYKITVPGGSTVDPEDPSLDRDRYTAINLTTGATLIVVSADKKEHLDKEFEKSEAALRGKLENATPAETHTFDPAKAARSSAVTGDIKGERYVFETAECEGSVRGCVMVLEYREAKKAETVDMVRAALATFQIKD